MQLETIIPIIRISAISATFVLMVILILAAFGRYYWRFELLIHFVPYYALAALLLTIVLVLTQGKTWAWLAFVLFFSQAMQMRTLWSSQDRLEGQHDSLKILQFNVWKHNHEMKQVLDWLVNQAEDADIMFLYEVSDRWEEQLERLNKFYPHQQKTNFSSYRGMAIYSKMPLEEIIVEQLRGTKTASIRFKTETLHKQLPVSFYAIHPPPPAKKRMANSRNMIFKNAALEISRSKEPHTIVVGDFNSTRYSSKFKEMVDEAGLHNSWQGFGLKSTWPTYLLGFGITIDHLLVSPNIYIQSKEKGPALGSDHYPVVTELLLPL